MSEQKRIRDWTIGSVDFDVGDYEPAEFAEWFGYTIEPNPESKLGYSVTSPNGKRLGGFVAAQIINGYEHNPSGGSSPGGVAKGKANGSSVDPAQKLADSKAKAAAAFDKLDVAKMVERSHGTYGADDLNAMISDAQHAIAGATDAKSVTAALANMRKQIKAYKDALGGKLSDAKLQDSKTKILEKLPDASKLAGTRYDPGVFENIASKAQADIQAAATTEEVRAIVQRYRAEASALQEREQGMFNSARSQVDRYRSAPAHTDLQPMVKADGWEVGEVIRGSATDYKAYQTAIAKRAQADPSTIYSVVKSGDGTFTLITKPKDQFEPVAAKKATAKAGNLIGASEWADWYAANL